MDRRIIEDIYFHREKEDNWDLEEKANNMGFRNPESMLYVGYEVDIKVEITENAKGDIVTKIIELEGVDVSDKDIFI